MVLVVVDETRRYVLHRGANEFDYRDRRVQRREEERRESKTCRNVAACDDSSPIDYEVGSVNQ